MTSAWLLGRPQDGVQLKPAESNSEEACHASVPNGNLWNLSIAYVYVESYANIEHAGNAHSVGNHLAGSDFKNPWKVEPFNVLLCLIAAVQQASSCTAGWPGKGPGLLPICTVAPESTRCNASSTRTGHPGESLLCLLNGAVSELIMIQPRR